MDQLFISNFNKKLVNSDTDFNQEKRFPHIIQENGAVLSHGINRSAVTACSSNPAMADALEKTRSLILQKYNIPTSLKKGKIMKRGFQSLMIHTIKSNVGIPDDEVVKKARRRWRDMNAMDKLKYVEEGTCTTRRRVLRRI